MTDSLVQFQISPLGLALSIFRARKGWTRVDLVVWLRAQAGCGSVNGSMVYRWETGRTARPQSRYEIAVLRALAQLDPEFPDPRA